jgi:type II secretion system protein H
MGHRPEVARGFTLLELIVTLAVLGLAVAVVTPAIGRGTDTLRARAEVAGFAATLRHARERAITQQRAQRVIIDTKERRMSIVAGPVEGAPSPREAPKNDAGGDERPESRALSAGLIVQAVHSSDVVFDPRGVASGGEFKLTSGGIVYRVMVDRLTGRVRSVRE